MKRNMKNRTLVVGAFLLAAMLAFQPSAFADGIGKIIAVVQQLFGGVQIKVTAPTNGQALVFDGAGGLANGTPTATPSFPILAPDGTNAAPTYSFTAQAGTGMFRDTANGILGFSDGSVYCVAISGAGVYVSAGEGLQWTSGTVGVTPADLRLARGGPGNLVLSNTAGSFGLLQLGGTTSAFPAIKRNSNILEVKLADDSEYGTIRPATVQVADGSVGTPTYTWTNETTLGFYRSAAGVINATGTLISTSLGVNVTPGASGLTAATIEASVTAGGYGQRFYAVGNGSTSGGLFLFEKNRGTLAAPLIVQNNDQLGGFYFNGSTGTVGAAGVYATIAGYVDGVPSGTTSEPGRLVFGTTPSGSSVPSERWAILNTGTLVGTSGLAIGWSSSSTDLTIAADTRVLRGAAGNVLLDNNAGSFGLLQFGGTTSSFPALRITSARLEAVLADNSAFANFRNAITFSDTSVRTAADGVIGLSSSNGDSTASLDTGISRAAAATVAIGNGTQGNASGQLNLTTLSMLGKVSKYNNVTTAGFGVPATFGLDFRQGVTSADGAATTLYTAVNGTSVFRITSDIYATAVTSGTATYTVTWTQNSTTQTMVVNSTVINTLGTATDLINPDNGTNITAKLTGTFSQTVTVTALVEQLK